ncbi:MAG: NUDIX hydrolase [Candidatus Sericytochromatia bacterium]
MSVWAIIEEQGQILLVQRSATTSRAGQWCFPGGGIKRGETPETACLREAQEETGLRIAVGRLVVVVNGAHYFACALAEAEQTLVLKMNECQAYRWIEPAQLLSVGKVMSLRQVVPVLAQLGYTVQS